MIEASHKSLYILHHHLKYISISKASMFKRTFIFSESDKQTHLSYQGPLKRCRLKTLSLHMYIGVIFFTIVNLL